jgi:hypothetical protein
MLLAIAKSKATIETDIFHHLSEEAEGTQRLTSFRCSTLAFKDGTGHVKYETHT